MHSFLLKGEKIMKKIENVFTEFNMTDDAGLKWFENPYPDVYGVTYIVACGNFVKIGCTKEPRERMKSLMRTIDSVDYWGDKMVTFTPWCSNYYENEQFLHKYFEQYRISGTEFFILSYAKAVKAVKRLKTLTFNANGAELNEYQIKLGKAFIDIFDNHIPPQLSDGQISVEKKILDRVRCISFKDNGTIKTYFVAADLASVLGYKDTNNLIRNLSDGTYHTINPQTINEILTELDNNLGAEELFEPNPYVRRMILVNEEGLAEVVMSYDDKAGDIFRRWFADNVFKKIWNHKCYITTARLNSPESFPQEVTA